MSATRSPVSMPAATRPLATARTSSRNEPALTSSQSSPRRREKATAAGASVALRTTSSVRFPVAGMSTVSGEGDSRNGASSTGRMTVRGEVPAEGRPRDPIGSPSPPRVPAARALPSPRAEPEEVTMADQTTSSIVIDAPPSAVMDVIADFPAYPTWAKGVATADVVSEFPDGRAEKVFFKLDVSPIKDEYTLVYVWSGDEQVTWELDEGKMLKALDGPYILTDLGNGSTDVTYRLALDVSIPLFGMLKRKGEKILIDAALKGLKKRVESLA